jgi:hypothetical protein
MPRKPGAESESAGQCVARTASCLALICFLLVAPSARALPGSTGSGPETRQEIDPGVFLRYDFDADGTGRGLAPGLFLNRRSTLWEGAHGARRLLSHYGANLCAPSELDSRADFAESLLLPGNASASWGAAYEYGRPHGIDFLGPDVSVAAKVIDWGHDATAKQVVFSGGVAASLHEVLDLSLQFSRATNAPRQSDRAKVVGELGGPGLWATYLTTVAECRTKAEHVRIFGAFAAYLGDSKFHVAANGRRVFSLGVEKEFERRNPTR